MYKNSLKILNRPLTPHLTIYSSQLTSLYSIWHRLTGLVLIFSLILYLSFLKFTSCFIYKLTLDFHLWIQNAFFLVFMIFFFYHSLNGTRHISWDLGFILPIKNVLNSAKVISFIIFFYFIFLILKIIH